MIVLLCELNTMHLIQQSSLALLHQYLYALRFNQKDQLDILRPCQPCAGEEYVSCGCTIAPAIPHHHTPCIWDHHAYDG